VCNYTALLQTVLTFPASSLGFVLPQEGALAYGLKLDDRVRVLPNAKLRAPQPAAQPAPAPLCCSAASAVPACLPRPAVGRMWTKAGQAYDHGTALACDLKIKPSADETARVRPLQGRQRQAV
jgi:hypothetical protein